MKSATPDTCNARRYHLVDVTTMDAAALDSFRFTVFRTWCAAQRKDPTSEVTARHAATMERISAAKAALG